ncbi:hypothetical protein [Labrenzia sp. CE80]|uniref:hypothetical protein n=1 Tax=Labrenzia sp. CE80 TaxID=1788986 RepID=UPI00129B4906|nr:hypothetical protein [Labrenzia sp. CE80]
MPTHSELEDKLETEEVDASFTTPRSRRGSSEWIHDSIRFASELEYLEDANCSDHAMKLYGDVLADLDTSSFDPKSGRLISADGQLLSGMGMRLFVRSVVALKPMPYMKDEYIPDNFKPMMRYVSRKKTWSECKFKTPFSMHRK